MTNYRETHPYDKNWKIRLLLTVSFYHSLNWFTVVAWLKMLLGIEIPEIEFDLTGSTYIDGFMTYALNNMLMFLPINYYLIFHEGKFEEIISRYKKTENYKEGKIISFKYVIVSLLLCFGSAVFHGLVFK